MFINDLYPTQEGLRHHIGDMLRFARVGIFNKEAIKRHHANSCKLIQLHKMGGTIFIHDGHHRIKAIWLSGRTELHPAEYELEQLSLEDYLDINFDCGWVTPYNPHLYLRISDLSSYKESIMKIYRATGPITATSEITSRFSEYTVLRGNILHINDIS